MLNRKNRIKLLVAGSWCLFLLGCNKESFLQQQGTSLVVEEEQSLEEILTQDQVLLESKNVSGHEANLENESEAVVDNLEEGNLLQSQSGETLEKDKAEIAVHICGAVKNPGVYYLKEQQRLYEGIQKAGGFRDDADEDYLNQAMILEDGMKVLVPTKEETAGLEEREFLVNEPEDNRKEADRKVNLNTADETQLCTLPGIGVSRAKSIIAYREEHGDFQKIEDVMKVSGIKEAAFEKIKDSVTVSR